MYVHFIAICLLIATSLSGQSAYTQFDLLGEEQTKLGSDVLDIYQDDFGYIWLSTFNGLIRYDGNRFQFAQELYPALSAIPSSENSCAFLDVHKTLWIGTIRKGIFLLSKDGELREMARLFPADKELRNNRFRQILTHNEVIYFRGDEGLVAYAIEESGYRKVILPDVAKNVRQVFVSPTEIYFTTSDQIYKSDWTVLEESKPLSFPFLFVKNKDEIWLANHHGPGTTIYKLINEQWVAHEQQPFAQERYTRNRFLWDKNNRIWSYRVTRHTVCYDFSADKWLIQKEVPNHNLFTNRIRDIMVDNAGTVWIGANELALLRDNPSLSSFQPLPTNGRLIMDMVIGEKYSYYALEASGLYVVQSNNIKHYHSGNSKLAEDRISNVEELSNGKIGITHLKGFQTFTVENGFSELVSAGLSNRFSIWYDDHYWIAGANKLIKVDEGFKQKEYFEFKNNSHVNRYMNSLCLKSEKEWYVGMSGDSIYSFDMRSNTFSALELGPQPNHSLNQLVVNQRGDLAIAARNGLFIKPPDNDFIKLNDEFIKAVYWLNDSTLAASSQSKIFAYKWDGVSAKYHLVQDNLINHRLRLRSVAKVGDKICFGGDRGLDCISYGAEQEPVNYILNIERLTTDKQQTFDLLGNGEAVILPPGTRRIEIATSLICSKFQSAAKIWYRYNQGEWQILKNNLLNLVALSAGKHHLEFRGELPTYNFQSQSKELLVTIAHRWYEKKWVQLVGLIALLGVSILGIYSWQSRKRNEEIRDALLRSEIAESKLQSLTGQMSPHFVFNSLNSIQQMMHEGEQEGSVKYIQQFSKMFRFVLEYTDQSWVPINEEIDFIQDYMGMEQMRFDHSFEYRLEISAALQPAQWAMPPFFTQPSLENALKHGIRQLSGSGKIWVAMNRNGHQLHLTISDNGIGLEAAKKISTSFLSGSEKGIALIRKRVSQLEQLGHVSSFEIKDKLNTTGEVIGTEVTMILPLKKLD